MLIPPKLLPGDTVAFVAPSSPCAAKNVLKAAAFVEQFDVKVKIMPACLTEPGGFSGHGESGSPDESAGPGGSGDYLAAPDNQRAEELMQAFCDSNIKGVFAVRGGYGVQRILPMLDFGMIKKNPKIFAGYSDITALHTVLTQRCGFVCYHSPMPGTTFLRDDLDAVTVKSFLRHMFWEYAPDKIIENPEPLTTIVPGEAEGPLTGGNLSLVASSVGSPYEIDTRGKILFLEEVDEAPYKVDRLLMQLLLSGKLHECRGILLGSFTPLTIQDIHRAINDILVPLGKPLAAGLACGHSMPNITLPLGAVVRFGS